MRQQDLRDKLIGEDAYEEFLNEVESRMGDGMTADYQLNQYMRFNHPEIKYYGAGPPDDVNDIKDMEPESCRILNTSREGEHWTAVYRFFNGDYLFYDSFGRSFNRLFGSFMKNQRWEEDKDIKDTERDQEQDRKGYVEYNCGQRCIAFILVSNKLGYRYAQWI